MVKTGRAVLIFPPTPRLESFVADFSNHYGSYSLHTRRRKKIRKMNVVAPLAKQGRGY